MLGQPKKPDASAGSEMRRAEWETERDSLPPRTASASSMPCPVLLHQYLKLDICSAAKFREAFRDARPAPSSRPNKLNLFPFQKLPPSPFVWIKNEAEEADNGHRLINNRYLDV